MVRIGIIGIGFMGYTHFEAAKKLAGGQVTAISTRDEKKLAGRLDQHSGELRPAGGARGCVGAEDL